MSKRLKFAPEHVDPLLDGEKWVTIRPGSKDVTTKDVFELVDAESGEKFAVAGVDMVAHVDPMWVVNADLDGHRSYRKVGRLLEELRRYYPDADLRPDTDLTLIQFKNVRQAKGYEREFDARERRPEERGRDSDDPRLWGDSA